MPSLFSSRMMEKMSRNKRKFFGCERYPDCDFVSWERPVAEKCGKCGSYMVLKIGNKGEAWHLCANENCRNKVQVSQPEESEDA